MVDKSIYHKNDVAWNVRKPNYRDDLRIMVSFFEGLFNKAIIPLALVGHYSQLGGTYLVII